MGYYTYVSYYLKLKKGVDPELFNEAVELELKKSDALSMLKDAVNIDNSIIDCGEEDDTFQANHEIICNFLSKYLCYGEITVEGEFDDDRWMIKFNEDGSWKVLNQYRYYGELYDHFLDTYDMPEELKESLNKWWIAKNL